MIFKIELCNLLCVNPCLTAISFIILRANIILSWEYAGIVHIIDDVEVKGLKFGEEMLYKHPSSLFGELINEETETHDGISKNQK